MSENGKPLPEKKLALRIVGDADHPDHVVALATIPGHLDVERMVCAMPRELFVVPGVAEMLAEFAVGVCTQWLTMECGVHIAEVKIKEHDPLPTDGSAN